MIQANLFERVLLGTAALVIFVLLFFFLAAALVLGTVVVAALFVRHWWFTRRIRQADEASTITTEYTVVEREPAPVERRLPDDSGSATEHRTQEAEQARRPER